VNKKGGFPINSMPKNAFPKLAFPLLPIIKRLECAIYVVPYEDKIYVVPACKKK